VVFVLDSSGSIRDNNPRDGSYDNWGLLLEFVTNIIDVLPIGPNAFRFGVVRFSDRGESMIYLNEYLTDKPGLIDAVAGIQYIGSNTNTASGLREMAEGQFLTDRGDRVLIPNIAIVITDGVSTIDKELTITTAVDAQARDITIFAVGITGSIDEEELRLISSPPQKEEETYWKITDFTRLDDIVQSVVSRACLGQPGKYFPQMTPLTYI
jgi:collagen type VI alpha